MIPRLASLFLVLISSLSASAAGISLSDSTLVIGPDVTAIDEYAFKDRADFNRVVFEGKSSLNKIGDYAFLGCRKLREIKLPESLRELGEGCFRECSSLKEINLPKGLKAVPKAAFAWCSSLKKMKAGRGLEDIGAHAFAYCSELRDIAIPATVRHIGNNAFSNCTKLWRVFLPSSITELESYAFSGCTDLREATLPANSHMLGELIFSGCDELRKLIIDEPLPPKFDCDSGIFEPEAGFNYAQCVLYVPERFMRRYRIAKGWTRFVHIRPIVK